LVETLPWRAGRLAVGAEEVDEGDAFGVGVIPIRSYKAEESIRASLDQAKPGIALAVSR